MNITDEQLQSFSRSQILEYTLQLRQEIREYGYVYQYTTSWFDLPEEIREIVINEMEPETVSRFKQCSKLCAEEARKSKNSMYKIELNYCGNVTNICFHLSKTREKCPHFRYTFRENKSNKCKTTTVYHEKINYQNWALFEYSDLISGDFDASFNLDQASDEKWKIVENGDCNSVVVKYLEKFIEEYKYSLKSFIHDGNGINLSNLNLKNLKNLQRIEFDDHDVLENNIMTIEQILKCTQKVVLPKTELSFDQLIQLKGKYIEIQVRNLTNEQIKRYLKMWEDGEIDENIGYIIIKSNGLEILEEEYYTDGLLTVFGREEPARKRRRAGETSWFNFMSSRQKTLKTWLSNSGIYVIRT